MDKLTRNMSTQLFTGASKQLKTRLSTVTVRFFGALHCKIYECHLQATFTD
jgi:hypothetical protein